MMSSQLYAALPKDRAGLVEVLREIAVMVGAGVDFPEISPPSVDTRQNVRRPKRGGRR